MNKLLQLLFILIATVVSENSSNEYIDYMGNSHARFNHAFSLLEFQQIYPLEYFKCKIPNYRHLQCIYQTSLLDDINDIRLFVVEKTKNSGEEQNIECNLRKTKKQNIYTFIINNRSRCKFNAIKKNYKFQIEIFTHNKTVITFRNVQFDNTEVLILPSIDFVSVQKYNTTAIFHVFNKLNKAKTSSTTIIYYHIYSNYYNNRK